MKNAAGRRRARCRKLRMPTALAMAVALSAGLASCDSVVMEGDVRVYAKGEFTFKLHPGVDSKELAPMLRLLELNATRIKADLGVKDAGSRTIHVRGDWQEHLATMEQLIGGRYFGVSGYIANANRIELLSTPNLAQDALHEYAHTVSLYVNRRFINNPRWLWEAIAAYESGEFYHPRALPYMAEGNFPSIAELNGDIGAGETRIYKVGYLLVEFMKARWGMPAVLELIRNGGDIPEALDLTVVEFESLWKLFVTDKYFTPLRPYLDRTEF
jgi:hypothetical protein